MSTSIQRIYAATDFSAAADRALDRAVELAQAHGAELILLHALQRGDWLQQLAADPILSDGHERILAAAGALLTEQCARRGLPASSGRVLDQPLHRALAALQGEQPAQLLVMGARGESDWADLLLGSTADRVLQAQALPVLLVRTPAEAGYARIGIATDFSPASAQAAAFALCLSPASIALLLHVDELPFDSVLSFAGVGREAIEDYRGRCTREAMHSLEAFAHALGPAGERLVPALRQGRPAHVLAAFVDEARIDLMVVGASGRSQIERGLLGSISRHAASGLRCDVLVVPEA
jgi:nucleotide-binding universal stress UspA family protein